MMIPLLLANVFCCNFLPTDAELKRKPDNFSIFIMLISYCSVYAVMLGTIGRSDCLLNNGVAAFGGLVTFFLWAGKKKSGPAILSIIQIILGVVILACNW